MCTKGMRDMNYQKKKILNIGSLESHSCFRRPEGRLRPEEDLKPILRSDFYSQVLTADFVSVDSFNTLSSPVEASNVLVRESLSCNCPLLLSISFLQCFRMTHIGFYSLYITCCFDHRTPLVAQTIKHLATMRETRVRSLGQEDLLEKEMATHSSSLAWKIPWVEEHSKLQSMGSQRVGHD